jgi:hypothetical protein
VSTLRKAIATGVLVAIALLALSPIPARTCLFLQEFESSSSVGDQVSLVERVVYSLIQASERAERATRSGV